MRFELIPFYVLRFMVYHLSLNSYKENGLYTTAIKILKATIGIESNRQELLPSLPFKIEVKSLLTDFRQVEEIDQTTDLDGYISVEESSEEPSYEFLDRRATFKGPFLKLTKEASDLRFSLYGNQGFLYRYTLYLLEKKHEIYNLHACALLHEEKSALYVIIGGAGSGKTVFLLSGLVKGLKLFSTETVHFRMGYDDVTWFMGSLVDNVRFGTLMYDFPQFLPDIQPPKPDEVWQKKIALDLSSYRTHHEVLTNLESIHIFFPRIEKGHQGFLLNPIQNQKKAAKGLFDNISQKLTETVVLYDKIPVVGLDEEGLTLERLHHVDKLLKHKSIKQIASILSNPQDCWGDLIE